MYRSTKGASKARRDQINTEIRNLRELLPISDADKARLSYLHIMSLACMYTRKSVFFAQEKSLLAGHEENERESLLSLGELSELMNSLPGFLLLISSEGKLLYLSDTVAEHLGHSMVDLVAQSDSVFDIIEPNDHFILRSNLVPATVTDTDRLFRCRFNTSKFIRRQSVGNKLMLVRARCLSLPTSASSYWSSNPVWMCSCSPLDPRIPYPSSPRNPLLTPPPDQSFFLACFQTRHGRDMKILEAHDSVSVYLGYDAEMLRSRSWYSLLHPRDLPHASAKHCALLCESGERQAEMVVQVEALDGSWVWLYVVLQLESGEHPISSLNYVISESEAWSVRQQLCLEENQVGLYLGGGGSGDTGLSHGPDALGLLCQAEPAVLSSPEQVFTPSSSGLSAQSFDFSLPTSSQSSSDELAGAGPPEAPQYQHQHQLSHLHQLLRQPQQDQASPWQWRDHPTPLQMSPEPPSAPPSTPRPPPVPVPYAPSLPKCQSRAEFVCTPPYTPRFGGTSSFSFGEEQSALFCPSAPAGGRAGTVTGGGAIAPIPIGCAPPADAVSTLGLAVIPTSTRLGKGPLVEQGSLDLPEICGPLFVDVPHGHFPSSLPEGLLTPEASPTTQALSLGPSFLFPMAPSAGPQREEIEQLEISLLAQYISVVAEGFCDNPLHPKPPALVSKPHPYHPASPSDSCHSEVPPVDTRGLPDSWTPSDIAMAPEGISLLKDSVVMETSPSDTPSSSPLSTSSHTLTCHSSSSSSSCHPKTFSSYSMQCSPPAPEVWSSPCQSQGAQSPIGEYLSSVQSTHRNHTVGGGLPMGPGLGEEGGAFSGLDATDVEMEVLEGVSLPMDSQSSTIPASPLSTLSASTSAMLPGPAPGTVCAQSLLEELVAMETVFGPGAPVSPQVGQHPELYQLPTHTSPQAIYQDGTSEHTF